MRIENCSQIYTLGPKGTFSDEASQTIRMPDTKVTYTRTFIEALVKVSDNPGSLAVVPVENSVAGTVAQVQDSLVSEDMVILAETNLLIEYALMANAELNQIELCYSHPQAFEQCSGFLSKNLINSQNQFTRSNIDSGIQFLKSIDAGKNLIAAVVPLSFANTHSEWAQSSGIQDYKNNTTRFLIVGRRNANEEFDFSREKTSLFVEFQEDRSGMLYQLLSVFNLFQVNLCRLESRPSKDTPWSYVFYVDFYNSPETVACLEVLRVSNFRFQVLGSYDLIS